jgi:hypothetical protein
VPHAVGAERAPRCIWSVAAGPARAGAGAATAAQRGGLTWHLIWWWTEVSAALAGEQAAGRAGVDWPGSAAAAEERLRALAAGWNRLLDSHPDLDVPIAYPRSDPRPARYTLAWVNEELMKNVAEIGAVRHVWAASRDHG